MEDVKSSDFPCVEYLTAQPASLEQIFYVGKSMVYMYEGQYYLATDSQMMLLDNETANQELATDSIVMVKEGNEYIPDQENDSYILCTIDEGINQQEEVYEFKIVQDDQQGGESNHLNENEGNIHFYHNEVEDLVKGKNLEVRKEVNLKHLREMTPKRKKKCTPENRLSTYLSGKLIYEHILDVKKVDPTEMSEEYYESVNRTLIALMQMDSLRKSFENNPLIIKVNELECSKEVYKGKIHGFMKKGENNGWCFINFNDKYETDVINEAKIKFRFTSHVCATITLSRFMGNLRATKVFQSLEQKEYICIVCYKEFESTKGLQHHYNTHLDTDPDLLQPSEIAICTCEICNKLMKSRILQNPTCNICEQKYRDAWTLKRHLLTHTGVRPYSCNLCDRSFAFVGDLNTHRKTHYGAKMHVYVCGVCGRTFSRQGNLLRHAGIHNNGEHKCHICGSSYQYASSLTRHIMQTHVTTNT